MESKSDVFAWCEGRGEGVDFYVWKNSKVYGINVCKQMYN
jgi:hypothetical protein